MPTIFGTAGGWWRALLVAGLLGVAWPAFAAPDAAVFDAKLKQYRSSVYRHPEMDMDPLLADMQAALPPGDALRKVQYETSLCSSEAYVERMDLGMEFARRVVDDARTTGDGPTIVMALLCLSGFRQTAEGAQQSIPDIIEAKRIAEGLQSPELLGDVYFFSGIVASLVGQQADSLLDFQRARDSYKAAGIREEIPALLDRIAVSYRRIGYHDRAERMFRQAATDALARGDVQNWSMNMLQIAYLYNQTAQPERAIPVLREAMAKVGARGHAIWRNAATLALAEALIRSGHVDEGLRTLAVADAGFAAIKDVSSTGLQHYVRAMGLTAQGLHRQAIEQLDKADAYFEHDGNLRYKARSQDVRSQVLAAMGRQDDATKARVRYLELELQLREQTRLEQGTLLEAQEKLQKKEIENLALRADRDAKQVELEAANQVRRWQWIALVSGLLATLLLALRVIQRLRSNAMLARLAMIDPTTGVASRINVITAAQQAFADTRRNHGALSLMMIDADHFKRINDTLGHQAGDEVLKRIAQACSGLLRESDTLGRYGGEEFLVVCPGMRAEVARQAAERMLAAVRAIAQAPDMARLEAVSVSIGIATLRDADDAWDALLQRADRALYSAKRNGRDRVEIDA